MIENHRFVFYCVNYKLLKLTDHWPKSTPLTIQLTDDVFGSFVLWPELCIFITLFDLILK